MMDRSLQISVSSHLFTFWRNSIQDSGPGCVLSGSWSRTGALNMTYKCWSLAIVLVHWLLTVWACMAWPSLSFMWGNFSVLAVGVWAIAQRDSVDAVLMFLVGITLTILTDIIHFGVYFSPGLFDSSVFRFSAGMAILNLLLKPASCFFVYQMYRERGGEYSVNFGFPSVSRNREAYQSIDQQDESSSPPNPFNQAQDTSRPGVRTY